MDEGRDWLQAVENLIKRAEPIYQMADIFLKMDLAIGRDVDLARIQMIEALGEALSREALSREKVLRAQGGKENERPPAPGGTQKDQAGATGG